MQRAPLPPPITVLAIATPLAIAALAIGLAWPWWAALLASGVIVVGVTEIAGVQSGVSCAVLAAAGTVLVLERSPQPGIADNGLALVAVAALLILAVVFGVDRPPSNPPRNP
ncbi:MAG: hypothetical protein R2715_06545 [Ilumatobacteraceae bacterium]